MQPVTLDPTLCYISVKTRIPLSIEEVAARFDRRLFDYLKPSFPRLLVDRYDGQKMADRIHLRIGIWPFYVRWHLRISADWSTETEWGFEDEGLILPFPLTAWRHQHRLHRISDTETEIEDFPGFRMGAVWLTRLLLPLVRKQFEGRSPQYVAYFCGKNSDR